MVWLARFLQAHFPPSPKNILRSSPIFWLGVRVVRDPLPISWPGQYRELRHIWLHELSTPDYISFRRLRRICDIDYLVDTIFSKKYPLNVAPVLTAPTQLFLSTTCVRTGKSRFFTQHEAALLEIIRASMAIPIVYGRSIAIKDNLFFDGNFSASLQDCVDQAAAAGAEKILVLDNSLQSRFVRLLFRVWAVFFAPQLVDFLFGVWGAVSSKNLKTPNGVELFTLQLPHRHGALDTDPQRIAATFAAGQAAVAENPDLEEFLSDFALAA